MFAKFDKSYREAVDHLHGVVDTKPGDYSYEHAVLVKWIIETDINPYSYLPQEWASSTESAEGMSSLCHVLHHAMYDDGDISFVSVNGKPRILFVHSGDVSQGTALTAQEMGFADRWGTKFDIKVLDITPSEFVRLREEYEKADIKGCFLADSRSHGVGEMAKYYKANHSCFEDCWVYEVGGNK